ncbi:MAG TPA: permease-like cell division protein FtsX [Ignavibacteria bacterium]|nr:permease-like cell division protein FtsX [Ignavibacteria bacterium]
MRLNLKYIFKESLRSLNAAKLSTLASILTITISLLLITLYYTISIESGNIIKNVKDKVEIEFYLVDEISQSGLDSLKEELKRTAGVKSIKHISKDDALKIFEDENGSEMTDILEYNPLPASVRINLYDEYKSKEKIEKISENFVKNPYITEVAYPKKMVEIIESNSSSFLFYNLIILIVVILASIFLVSNTIRLVISAKRKNIEIKRLLGATKGLIQTPFLIDGVIQGLLGSLLFILVTIVFRVIIQTTYSELTLNILSVNYLFVIITGVLLGVIGSYISIKRFLIN